MKLSQCRSYMGEFTKVKRFVLSVILKFDTTGGHT